jgi:hypothetical protein
MFSGGFIFTGSSNIIVRVSTYFGRNLNEFHHKEIWIPWYFETYCTIPWSFVSPRKQSRSTVMQLIDAKYGVGFIRIPTLLRKWGASFALYPGCHSTGSGTVTCPHLLKGRQMARVCPDCLLIENFIIDMFSLLWSG